jgi:hypothetical protein
MAFRRTCVSDRASTELRKHSVLGFPMRPLVNLTHNALTVEVDHAERDSCEKDQSATKLTNSQLRCICR